MRSPPDMTTPPKQHALPTVGAHFTAPEGLEKSAEEDGMGTSAHCQPLVAPCQVQQPLLAFYGFISLEGRERLCDVAHLSPEGQASAARIQKRGTASIHTALQPVPAPAREEVEATYRPRLLSGLLLADTGLAEVAGPHVQCSCWGQKMSVGV